MENLGKKSTSELTRLIASKAPAPGGGGACALVGALASSLGAMVGIYSLGKKKDQQREDELQELLHEAEDLRVRFLDLMDKDAESFIPLSRAYGIPKEDPNRAAILEACLREAAKPPLEIFHLTCRTIELLEDFAEKGSAIMVSDAATGAAFAQGALKGAAINVKVNTHLMKDRTYAKKIEDELDLSLETYSKRAEEVFLSLWKKY